MLNICEKGIKCWAPDKHGPTVLGMVKMAHDTGLKFFQDSFRIVGNAARREEERHIVKKVQTTNDIMAVEKYTNKW